MLKKNSDSKNIFRQMGLLTSIPVILVGGPMIGFFAGQWVDQKFNTRPYATLALIIYGFLGSIREVIRIVKLASKDS